MQEALSVFISYAHEDDYWRKELVKHLSGLKRDGLVSEWHDRDIAPGASWDETIRRQLSSADIVLLLISADFMASKFANDVEVENAFRRHEAGEAVVIPVVVRDCDWSTGLYGRLQALPPDGQPLADLPNRDKAFTSVIFGLRGVANKLLAERRLRREEHENALAAHRVKAQEVLNDGTISPGERDTLDDLKAALGLSDQEAARIETEALAPVKRLQEAKQGYERTLRKILEFGWPISAENQADLDLRKRDLGLKDDDVAAAAGPILAEAKARHEAGLPPLAAPRAAHVPDAATPVQRASPPPPHLSPPQKPASPSPAAEAAAPAAIPAPAPATAPAPAPKGEPRWLKWGLWVIGIWAVLWILSHL